jgi:hypothetical protein
LKNISGSSRDRTSGGNKVTRYVKGLFCPLGSLSTAKFYRRGNSESIAVSSSPKKFAIVLLLSFISHINWRGSTLDLLAEKCDLLWKKILLQSAMKSESPRTNPMYDVPIARNENASTIGCKQEVSN